MALRSGGVDFFQIKHGRLNIMLIYRIIKKFCILLWKIHTGPKCPKIILFGGEITVNGIVYS